MIMLKVINKALTTLIKGIMCGKIVSVLYFCLSHFPRWVTCVKNMSKATQPEGERPFCCLWEEVGGDAVT